MAEQCSILFITAGNGECPHFDALTSLGFRVVVSEDLPPTEIFTAHHAVVVRVKVDASLTTLAAHLRAKPRFGRRALIALVSDDTPNRARREAVNSGFDLALSNCCSARDLAANILRLLRPYPEYRCLLRAPGLRRKVA